ncbi:MAG: FlgD immunoglobulin-like domain containing protein [bacterium]
MRPYFLVSLMAIALVGAPSTPAHAARNWHVDRGTLTLSLDDSHLSDLGLKAAGERTTAVAGEEVVSALGTGLRSFVVSPGDLNFTSKSGAFEGFVSRSVPSLAVEGGLTLASRAGAAAPAFLYDCRLNIDLSRGKDGISLVTADPAMPQPLNVVDAGVLFREDRGELAVCFADLQISTAWARALGHPELAGQWVGTLDLRLDASTPDPKDRREVLEPPQSPLAPLDLQLGGLSGIVSQGRTGTYPNGLNGLSAQTMSCNPGSANIPWNAPMAETHPFIALALFRVANGVLEEVGQNWIKHAFFALSDNGCGYGCPHGSDGSYLAIGCSDIYSAGNNGTRYYLGPRKEVDPYRGTWTACGSFFDEPVVHDADCNRNYDGTEPNNVNHRLVVADGDLGNAGATYFYEGAYYVANDGVPDNNIGWRQCTMSWNGSTWIFSTVGGGVTPNYGCVAETWGDSHQRKDLATDDGPVVLSEQVTDLGGGSFHYEYALYNLRSNRGVYSFSVPVGSANLTNVGFHDIDQDGTNDWTVTVANGVVTWATQDYNTNPDANWLSSEKLYNFRFDADVPPVAGQVQCGIFRPGVGTSCFIDTQTPNGGATAVAELQGVSGLALSTAGPNPFGESARIAFSLPRREAARISVYDVTGRTVRVLLDDVAPAGSRILTWDGRDGTGNRVASGIYLISLETADGVRTAKMARLR